MFKRSLLAELTNSATQRPTTKQNYYRLTNTAGRNVVELSGFIGWWDDEALWLRNYLREHENEPIEFKIASHGGDVYTGQQMYNAIKAHKGKTTATVEQAFSIASHIAVACDVVNIVKGAQMMVHAVSGACYGTEADMTAYAELIVNAKAAIADSYVSKTGHDAEYWLDIMKNDAGKYFSDAECVEIGLADYIIDPTSLTNNVSDPTKPPETNLTNNVDDENMQKELDRQKAVRNLFNSLQTKLNLPFTLLNSALDDENCDLQAASAKFAGYTPEPTDPPEGKKPLVNFGGGLGGSGSDSTEMVRNVLLNRAGIEEIKPDYKNYAGLSLLNAATQLGIQGAGESLVNAALTHQDFIDVVGEIAQRSVQLEVENNTSLVKRFTKTERKNKLGEFGITDVHQAKSLGKRDTTTGEFPLHQITGEPERKGTVDEFGRQILLTRKAVINDEFGLLSDIPRQFVDAAYRTADKHFIELLKAHAAEGKITAETMKELLVAMANTMESQTTSDGDDLFYTGGLMLCNAANKRIAKQINDSQYADGIGTANPAYSTFERFTTSTRLGDTMAAFAKGQTPISLAVLHGRETPTLIQNSSVNPINGVGFGIVWDFGLFINNPKALVTGQVAAPAKMTKKEKEAYEAALLAAQDGANGQ